MTDEKLAEMTQIHIRNRCRKFARELKLGIKVDQNCKSQNLCPDVFISLYRHEHNDDFWMERKFTLKSFVETALDGWCVDAQERFAESIKKQLDAFIARRKSGKIKNV